MRSSNKSRSRNKNNNRNRSMGNIVNRVFDSAGPEGKVRGTPQQIIEKYTVLARDAQLGGDRVAAENFQQHAEHYTRMLEEAQKEQAERQAEQQQRQQQQRQDNNAPGQQAEQGGQPRQESARGIETMPAESIDSGLVDTPENANGASDPGEAPKPRGRRPRSRAPKADVIAEDAAVRDDGPTETAAE